MTWEEKLAALTSLKSDISLKMRVPGDWYVFHIGVDIKRGGFLSSRCGNGTTPQEAVEDHWKLKTELEEEEYIVLDAGNKEKRRAVKWNGYMWADIVEYEGKKL